LPVCVVPNGKVGLVIDDETTLSTLDGSHAQKALGSCDCSVGTKRFYTPASRTFPNDTYTDNQDAFILDSTRGCANLCFCNEARTKCWVGQTANTYVEFSPSCTGGKCHVYAVPYTQVFDNIQFNGVKNSAT
uniref:Uncharacterized protein n=1 Tax=Acrobeloides nanus TaxID=290746 RepID=A0A914DH11_9BILA